MPTADEVKEYMNLLASAASVVAEFSLSFSQLLALQDFENIRQETFVVLEVKWKNISLHCFFVFLRKWIQKIKRWKRQKRFIVALAICEWMDEKLNFFNETKGLFCANELIPFDGSSIIEVGVMNRNYRQTGVQVFPKFEVCRLYYPKEYADNETSSELSDSRSFANRNAFSGLNGTLKKVSIVSHEKNLYIHNVILPPSYTSKSEGEIPVAFCPMCDTEELILKNTTIRIGDYIFSGQSVIGLKDPEKIFKRFCQDWTTAAGEADIVFFPEALGSNALMEIQEQGKYKYNKTVFNLQKALLKNGGHSPLLTIMPSLWSCGENRTDIVYMDGRVIGTQKKYVPYVNEKGHVIEAIYEAAQKEYYVFHIPGYHRIVVLICSEFLAICNDHKKMPLFDEIGATLVIVPSYSHGEADFLNSLPSLKPFGTTVIWGNCCGAVKPRKDDVPLDETTINDNDTRVIGASSVAGTYAVCCFRGTRNCKGSCKDRQSCAFAVPLPLKVVDSRPNALEMKLIRHLPENDTFATE